MTPQHPTTPSATYRLQLQPDFGFGAAAAAVPYLASLGVSHLHLSPVLEAVPGSTHGYDVVDHARVRAELGGEDGLRSLARTAHEHGLGLVVDIVPNHMAASVRHNGPFRAVLRDGPSSPYARWFDIDWDAQGGRVLLPVLGHRLGEELPHLKVDGDVLRYYDHAFPLRPGTRTLPLPELLDAQWYRLSWWRLARTELNYRRFFTISDLIAVRVEDPEVFDATHATVLRLLREGVVDGLRIDHPDGLADPGAYLQRLSDATGGRWTVVEKILEEGEQLPAAWPVSGTTGYDALRQVDGLFVDPAGADQLLGLFRRFTGVAADAGGRWADTVRRSAHRVVTYGLATELDRLTREAAALCALDPQLRDHAPWALRTALCELLVRVPVYRPYVTGGVAPETVLTASDAAAAKTAFAVAEEAGAVDAVRELALGRHGAGPRHAAFRARFAQVSSALRAKSVEDAAFYRYTPLLSALEVGGCPHDPAVTVAAFHGYCARVQRDWPYTSTVLSTHDTKRSADVRAAVSVLTQCPDRWEELLADVTERTAHGGGASAPDPQIAWAAWQMVAGLGPAEPERLQSAMLKHAREAGLYTTWTEPNAAYEEAVRDFVASGPCGPPGHEVLRFMDALLSHVRANVLGAALVQLTMPGVPDLYQGSEREYRALVDPDNRGPALFDEKAGSPLSAEKEALTAAALRLRRAHPDRFGGAATYEPLTAEGPGEAHCVSYVRSGHVVVAATRLSLRLAEAGGWQDTRLALPDGEWTELLDPGRRFSGRARVAELFGRLPVALLVRSDEGGAG
ncbi:malto-oligosyltrehalose synthase [Streptomyces sp. VRA16 Mangrove soil]|uniref:malto-oligosyltrehalose synthase n=1 Tax=Streptomyces sp. VRA16 Mangrove soil TaxID=2817434 RepID=UPI001A9F54EA|nr:malto-oligosyltrehalose synthase [Streptomyces sp. VRA16 Mangrove soil]MBO1335503.1 malto-oligosyltrehalose synthase [Streptomyces sp. VRA16 Mangrove soil]